jgi:tRNA dimethylallyltransferase
MKNLFIILGQTATGKTNFSIELAKELHGEIVSADSRQVYLGMDIGTAKITPEEMQGIPHHMIDVVDPRTTVYTVADYVRDGRQALHNIWDRNKTPIVVGGTGMYIDALVGRITIDGPGSNPELRTELEVQELSSLNEQLYNLDSQLHASIDTQNKVRVVRALERLLQPNKQTAQPPLPLPNGLHTHWIGLRREPTELKERIHQRNVKRLEYGLVEEIKQLHQGGLSWERMEQLGLEYRYVSQYARGLMDFQELLETLDTKTWQYAKRQATWFKKNNDIQWLDASNPGIAQGIVKSLK